MKELGKAAKQHFRELAGIAHERELNLAFQELHREFERWQRGELHPFELNDRIHRFHQGVSRDLYKKSFYGDADTLVASAVGQGILKKEKVKLEFYSAIERILELREQRNKTS